MAKNYKTIKQRKDFYRESGEIVRKLYKDAKNTSNLLGSQIRKDIANTLIGILPKSFVGATKALTRNTEAGELFYDLKKVAENLEPSVLSDSRVYNIMIDIKTRAQELAPVDKRYLRAVPPNKKNKSFTLPAFSSLKEREKGLDFSAHDAIRKRRTKGGAYLHTEAVEAREDMIMIADKIRKHQDLSATEKLSLYAPTSFQQINIPDKTGKYSAEAQNYLYNILRGNRRAERRYLWFDKSSESINKYNINHKSKGKRNKVIGTPFSKEDAKNRRSGGEEELRRSAEYDKENFIISFDTTKFTKEKYNYAAIQHERFDFVHLEGQSHFLRTAVLKYRKMLIETITNVTIEKFGEKAVGKKVIKPKDIQEVKRIQIRQKSRNESYVSKQQRKLVERTSKRLRRADEIRRTSKKIESEIKKTRR